MLPAKIQLFPTQGIMHYETWIFGPANKNMNYNLLSGKKLVRLHIVINNANPICHHETFFRSFLNDFSLFDNICPG
jgi:hypothetical protein